MAGYKNIKPRYKKGESGNPTGRPKGSKNRSTILRKWLEVATTIKNPITKKDEKVTVEDEIILALIREARKGNIQAIKEIQDSMHGKMTEKQEVEHSGEIATNLLTPKVDGD